MHRATIVLALGALCACSEQQTCPDGYGIRSDGTCIPVGGMVSSTPTTSTPPPMTTTTPTEDTTSGWTGPCEEVETFAFELVYAWDDSAGVAVGYSISGMPQSSRFTILFGPTDWDGEPQTAVCEKAWYIDGMQPTDTAGAVNGFRIDAASRPPDLDTCAEGVALGSVCPDFFDSSNGFAIESTAYVWEVFADAPAPELGVDPIVYWSATLDGDLFPSETYGFSWGQTVDANFEVTAFTPTIARSTMPTASGQTDALYKVHNPFVWSFW